MAAAPVLTGELGLIGLFDLGQLLMLNGATGELLVAREGRRAYLYFDRGQIVNAVDEDYREGEGAAYRIFTWRTGTYEFRAEPPSGARAINESTEGLMLEAARRMDESGVTVDGERATDKLRQRTGELDALREAFQSLARDAIGVPEADPAVGDSPFARLRGPGDALLFRPGHLPRLLHGGRWRDAGSTALDPAAFDQFRARLLEGVLPAGAPGRGAGVATHVVAHEDGRRYAITRVAGPHEALWVRAAELSSAEAAPLEGPVALLREVLISGTGLLIAAGTSPGLAEEMFHACIARLAQERAATAVIVADHGRWRHAEHAGVLVRAGAAEAREILRAVGAGVAAYDVEHAPLSIDALHVCPMVVAAVVAPDPSAVVPRWCARVGRRRGDGLEALLQGVPVVAVHARRDDDGRTAFQITRHDFEAAGTSAATPRTGGAPAATAEPAIPGSESARFANDDVPPPAGAGEASDPMAVLAAELGRTLRKAA